MSPNSVKVKIRVLSIIYFIAHYTSKFVWKTAVENNVHLAYEKIDIRPLITSGTNKKISGDASLV